MNWKIQGHQPFTVPGKPRWQTYRVSIRQADYGDGRNMPLSAVNEERSQQWKRFLVGRQTYHLSPPSLFLFVLSPFIFWIFSRLWLSLNVSVFYSSPSLHLLLSFHHSDLYFSVITLWIQVWSSVFTSQKRSLGMDWPPMWLVSADPSLTIKHTKHSVHCRIDWMFTASLRFSKRSLGAIRGPWWDADPDKLVLSVNKRDKTHNNHYCGDIFISPPTN